MRLIALVFSIGILIGLHQPTWAKTKNYHRKTHVVTKTNIRKQKTRSIQARKRIKKEPAPIAKTAPATNLAPTKSADVTTPSVNQPSVQTTHLNPPDQAAPPPLFPAKPSQASIYGTAQLVNELNRIVGNNPSNANIAVFVKSMKYNDVVYSRNPNSRLTPASTLKILTAEAGLIFLGPEYKFSTQLLTDAKTIQNGVLQGNLYIVLSGDPTLAYFDLYELMSALLGQQIHGIAGNVYIDNSAYDQNFYGPGWIWKDKGYCYAAPIGAGIFNRNCIAFRVAPAKSSGHPAQVLTSPKYFYPPIHNTVVTRKGGHCGVHVSKDAASNIMLDGCMAKGNYVWGVSYVLTDMQNYELGMFKNLLNRLAIHVQGKITFNNAPNNISIISTHTSKPLHLLVNDMLKKSDNVIAGALFKKIGQLYTRQPGSWQNGSFAVSQILSRRAGVNTFGLRILDGSGLSPDNLTTPAQMMQVLDFAFHHDGISYPFIVALPIAGVDGTLKHRMFNIARKVRAKTGTISGVVSLAGYAISADKEPLAFVIMINGNKGMGWSYREIEDKIATALTKYKRT